MKVVILAGGLGTRLGEETAIRPKPMVEIGGKPIIWHIMKMFSYHGLHEFIICLGYKGYMIKEYFFNYSLHMSDVTIDIERNAIAVHQNQAEPWKVTLVETGETTMTGGRLRRIRRYLDDGPFCMTYGDGVSDIDIGALIAFHEQEGRPATVTAVSPATRFGAMLVEGETVSRFAEKPVSAVDFINGGFFVLSPETLDLVEGDDMIWEREPLETLASRGQLSAYRHLGFWQPMDMLRDKITLEKLWSEGRAPWKKW